PAELLVLGTGRSRHHIGTATVELRADADEEVYAGGAADLLTQIGAERLAGDPSHDLADQESLRVDVIAVAGTRLPPRRLGGERLRHDVPVTPRARRQRAGNGRQRRLMRQEIAHRDPRLPRLGELEPVSSDRCVEVQPAGLDDTKRADGGDRLPDGVEIDERVALPATRPGGVGVATPQVEGGVPVDVDG